MLLPAITKENTVQNIENYPRPKWKIIDLVQFGLLETENTSSKSHLFYICIALNMNRTISLFPKLDSTTTKSLNSCK